MTTPKTKTTKKTAKEEEVTSSAAEKAETETKKKRAASAKTSSAKKTAKDGEKTKRTVKKAASSDEDKAKKAAKPKVARKKEGAEDKPKTAKAKKTVHKTEDTEQAAKPEAVHAPEVKAEPSHHAHKTHEHATEKPQHAVNAAPAVTEPVKPVTPVAHPAPAAHAAAPASKPVPVVETPKPAVHQPVQQAPKPAAPAAAPKPVTHTAQPHPQVVAPKPAPVASPVSKPAVQQAAPSVAPRPVQQPAPQTPKPQAPVQQRPVQNPAQQAPKPAPAVAPRPVTAPAAAAPKPVPQKPAKPVIKVSGQPTVRELSETIGMKVTDFIKKMVDMGVFATINQRLAPELMELVMDECGYKLEVVPMFAEKELQEQTEQEKPETLKPRPPVVTIMGHVDHGKTSLLDAIRKSNVVAGEAGAITQHIGAYKVETSKGTIVLLDTPGHEAFTAMRARGAQVTDIVILVVSATDGVMPQTIEAIDHAKAAGAPIIVAVNKIDLPGANPERIKQELARHGIAPEEWGGSNIMVEISAKKRINIEKLLEMIALQSEVMELKANPDKRGVASIIEAERDPKRGIVAHVLVSGGTIKVGDPFVVGAAYGRVRALINEYGRRIQSIGPSIPAEILGINGEPPQVGEMLYVVESEKEARQIAEKRALANREASFAHQKHVTLLGLKSQVATKRLKALNIILKGDVQGSIEAIRDSLEKIGNDEVAVKIIHAGAGNVNESDILLAKASDAVILGFHIAVEVNASAEAERSGIEIRNYEIIFELIDNVRAALEGMLEPDVQEVVVGKAEVKQAFSLSSGAIAGSMVLEGKIQRNNEARVLRGKEIVHKGKVSGLKRFKDDVREVEKGFECGILIEGYRQIQPGDIVEIIEKRTTMRRIGTGNNG